MFTRATNHNDDHCRAHAASGRSGDGTVAALQVLAAIQSEGRPASEICTMFEPMPQILENVGFDALPVRLGIVNQQIDGQWQPSRVAGYAVMVALLLIATLQVSEILGSAFFSDLVSDVIAIGGQILAALVALGIGIWLANLAARAIQGMGGANAGLVAGVARWAIIIFTVAIALRQIGIANEIIILAFGLPVAAVAVAFAVAFGVGGRQTAGRELDAWLERRRETGS